MKVRIEQLKVVKVVTALEADPSLARRGHKVKCLASVLQKLWRAHLSGAFSDAFCQRILKVFDLLVREGLPKPTNFPHSTGAIKTRWYLGRTKGPNPDHVGLVDYGSRMDSRNWCGDVECRDPQCNEGWWWESFPQPPSAAERRAWRAERTERHAKYMRASALVETTVKLGGQVKFCPGQMGGVIELQDFEGEETFRLSAKGVLKRALGWDEYKSWERVVELGADSEYWRTVRFIEPRAVFNTIAFAMRRQAAEGRAVSMRGAANELGIIPVKRRQHEEFA